MLRLTTQDDAHFFLLYILLLLLILTVFVSWMSPVVAATIEDRNVTARLRMFETGVLLLVLVTNEGLETRDYLSGMYNFEYRIDRERDIDTGGIYCICSDLCSG